MIEFVIPKLPPSVNKAYVTVNKHRILSREGQAYKSFVKALLGTKYASELQKFKVNVPYAMQIKLGLPKLENSGWPKSSATRYKRIDASNYVKIIEDAVAESSGIDDSNTLCVLVEKCKSEEETVTVRFWLLEEEGCPFHERVPIRRVSDSQY